MLSYLLWAALAGSAHAQDPSGRDMWIQAARAEVLTFRVERDTFAILNHRGNALSAVDVAWAFGDNDTYELAHRARRRQRAVGIFMVSAGPVLMIGGATQISDSQWRGVRSLEQVGVATLLTGIVATTAGMALLLRRRVADPSTYYTPEHAEAMVDEHNARLYRAWGLEGARVGSSPAPAVAVLSIKPLLGGAHLGIEIRR